ncbi:MAG: hypothetical protein L0228_06230 [Planctomycetes bacterium]|nr:hypothetical protein [Planctomycetota bacterium]
MTMLLCPKPSWSIRRVLIAILAVTSIVMTRQQAAAAELAAQAKSLRMAPADAAFYSASLRLKEQFDIFLESNAYAKLLEIPLVQFAKGTIETQWQQASLPGVKEFREYVDSPEGQEAVAVLKEMFADEVFLYGGNDITEWLQFFMEFNSIQRTVRIEAQASGEEPDEAIARRMLEIFEERGDEFAVPTLVWGFRIKDADRANQQLDVVHGIVRNLLDEKQPELAAHLQRDQIAGHEFLTLRLDGSMIPWDKLREEADDVDPEQFEKWRELVSKKTLAVALGVVDEFVLLSVGESTDHLENTGQGPFLADQKAIKRLEKHADERVASITYISEAVTKNLSSPEKTIEDLANSVDMALEEAEIGDEQRKQLIDDIRDLDLSKYMPAPGDTSAVVFLTDRGYEGFQYSTGTQPMMDSSKPLTILNHVGGSPMLCVASRSNDTVEDYDEAIAWLKRTARHVEKIAESKAKPEDWAEYLKYRDRVVAMLDRLNKANREFMYPAFADNQGALVMDVSAESQQWTTHMPKSPTPLPMLEVGVVVSVSDAENLRKGVNEYCGVFRDAIALAREINPDEVPEFEIPEPTERELDGGGEMYVYSLPEDWGMDEQVSPSAGLTDGAAALTVMPATAERLLASKPLEIDTSLDLDRPAATVMHFKFDKMIDTFRPWIDYGLAVAMGTLKNETKVEEDGDGEAEDGDEEEAAQPNPVLFQMGFVVPQIYQFLDVAKAFKSATSITYQEDGVWVTHSETHIEDLKDDE